MSRNNDASPAHRSAGRNRETLCAKWNVFICVCQSPTTRELAPAQPAGQNLDAAAVLVDFSRHTEFSYAAPGMRAAALAFPRPVERPERVSLFVLRFLSRSAGNNPTPARALRL